jgi:hypothetical protein
MKRPGDHEPAKWWETEDPSPKKPEDEQPAPEPEEEPAEETPPPTEDARGGGSVKRSEETPEHATRLAERRRVEIAKAMADVPEELRYKFLQALADYPGEWSLERGTLLFMRLVREETVETEVGPVVVRERLALRRDHPPVPLTTTEINEIAEAVAKPAETSDKVRDHIAKRLPDRDRIEVIIPDQAPEVIKPPESPGPEMTEATRRPEQGEPTVPTSDAEADAPKPDSVLKEIPLEAGAEGELVPPLQGNVELPSAAESLPPALPATEFEEIVESVYEEESPLPGETDLTTPGTGLPKSEAVSEPDASSEQSSVATQLGRLIEQVTEALDEANPLPPIAGGSPEWDEVQQRRRRPNDEEALESPAPKRLNSDRQESVIRPSRVAETRLLEWEQQYRTPEQRPDARMRRKARKLVRVLARRFGLRLTPETEALLLEIVLAPRIVGGRKVYGLGLNREELLGTIRELWLRYPAAAPRIDPQG